MKPHPSPRTLAELAQKQHSKESIFHKSPAIGTAELGSGVVCAIPYHNYDADALVIWGTADQESVQELIEGPWVPLLDSHGRAQVSLWVVDYADTVLGPYKELIFVFSILHENSPTFSVGRPLQQLPLFDDRLAYSYVYKLWLDQQIPIDYGRELFGADKYLDSAMKIEHSKGRSSFEFHHVEEERNSPGAGLLLSGNLELRDQLQLGGLVNAYGLLRTLGMASGARASWQAVTPPGIMDRRKSEQYNPVWNFVAETNPRFTAVDPNDEIAFGGELQAMDFRPVLYQHDPHLKTVLLAPWTYTRVA